MSKMVIFDVDTQKDFLSPNGNRYVGDDGLAQVANIENILIEALRNDIVLIGSTLSHPEGSYNGYCVLGTDNHEKINETMMVDPELYYNVAHTNHGIDMDIAGSCWQIIFEKQTNDIFDPLLGQPDNIHTFLRTENVEVVVIVGVEHRGSVFYTIEGLLNSKFKVKVVSDAVIGWDNLEEQKVLKDMGAEFITTEELVEEIKRGNYGEDFDS